MTKADVQVLLPKSMRYSGLEVLLPESKQCVWEQQDLSDLRCVRFSDKEILRIFGRRNGVRRRALQRVRNGHYFIDTLRSARVKSRLGKKKSPRELRIIQCEVLASQRGDIYRVYLVVNHNGRYIKSPFPGAVAAGNLFCAHMLGLLCICDLAQLNPTWDRIQMQEAMPANADQVQRMIIPIIAIFKHNLHKRK